MTGPSELAGAEDPDRELLAAAGRGDFDAFERLVERHQATLWRVAERLLGDREDALDAVQDVFLKVYRKASSFVPRAKVSTWLYRITVNHCLNRLRRRRIVSFVPFLRPGAEEPVAWEPPSGAPGAERELAARRAWREVAGDIAALPASQRAVLVLAKLEGLPYREIADVLGVTVGAVESRLFRAMRNLERAQAERDSRVQ